ncbi:MAG: hypothetical protein ACRDQZ_17355, partial [Mycobacteriales bacterium]
VVMSPSSATSLHDVQKRYRVEGRTVTALSNVSLELHNGSFTPVMDPPAPVRAPYLQCATGLDRPALGRYPWVTPNSSGYGRGG